MCIVLDRFSSTKNTGRKLRQEGGKAILPLVDSSPRLGLMSFFLGDSNDIAACSLFLMYIISTHDHNCRQC